MTLVVTSFFSIQAMDFSKFNQHDSIGLEDTPSIEKTSSQLNIQDPNKIIDEMRKTIKLENPLSFQIENKSHKTKYRILKGENNDGLLFIVYKTVHFPLLGDKTTKFELLKIKNIDSIHPYAYHGRFLQNQHDSAGMLNKKAQRRFAKIQNLIEHFKMHQEKKAVQKLEIEDNSLLRRTTSTSQIDKTKTSTKEN